MLQYTQHSPPVDLRDWIRLIWMLSTDASGLSEAEPVVPDGCAELIFNLGDPFEHRARGGGEFRAQPLAIVNGQLHGAVSLRSQGTVRLVGVRLQPWALGALIRMPANEITDQWLALGDITSNLLPDLRDHLMNIRAYESVPDVVAQHFRLIMSEHRQIEKLRDVLHRVASANATSSIANIAREVGMSERTLQRVFADDVGLSAKQYAKVLRVQRTVRLRQVNPSTTWTRAALDTGYYDQSHFVKDFRAVVGCAPTEFIVEPESLTDAFMTDPSSRTL